MLENILEFLFEYFSGRSKSRYVVAGLFVLVLVIAIVIIKINGYDHVPEP
ncbi:MAG: hypothetical protein HRT65_16185 [Flavobacteriaceae bacterium]|nr:hypothetical protein [Flavobacteriaceae bacterium]